MSLINDALKRAKQVQQKPAVPPAPGLPLRPVETARPLQTTRTFLLPIVVAVVLVFAGGLLIVLALSRGLRSATAPPVPFTATPAAAADLESPPAATGPNPVATAAIETPRAVSESAPGVTPPVAAPAPPPPVVVTQTVVLVETVPPPVVEVPPPPALPRLQGILFNPANPAAFLNGKSYPVGGRVGEFTIVAITRQAVTLERAGQTNVLTLED